MREKSVITRTIEAAGGVFAPGHLGELTQIVDFALVDAVLDETRAVQRRIRMLPARVVVYFVLGLALFEDCSYRAVWDKLTAGLAGLSLTRPHASSLSRARRRLGARPLKVLFETLAGTVAARSMPGAWWCGMRTVAFDGTSLQLPDRAPVTASGILPTGPVRLVGAIGRALLDNLLPTRRRQRMKARSLKSHSKYAPNVGQHPATAQTYTLCAEIAIMEKGLAPRPHR